jgi:hypothetical protein
MYGASVLGQILRRCADESVSDEQVARVFGPVGRMIMEGRFTRGIRRRALLRAVAPVAAALLLGLALLFML